MLDKRTEEAYQEIQRFGRIMRREHRCNKGIICGRFLHYGYCIFPEKSCPLRHVQYNTVYRLPSIVCNHHSELGHGCSHSTCSKFHGRLERLMILKSRGVGVYQPAFEMRIGWVMPSSDFFLGTIMKTNCW
jgi:hypothetical protein